MKGLTRASSSLQFIAYKPSLFLNKTLIVGKKACAHILKFDRLNDGFGRSRVVQDLLEWWRTRSCSDSVMLLFILIRYISGQAVSLMLIPEKCLSVFSCCNKKMGFYIGNSKC